MKVRSFENARLICFNDAATIIQILGHFSI